MSTSNNHRQAAKQFVKEWSGKGYEKGETQRFWLDLLHTIFGIDNPMAMMEFEIPVKTILKEKGSDFIDGYITATKVLIEQKGSHVDLSAKVRQSDGTELTPYQQARRYAAGLPVSMTPRWIVACNFTSFEVHDMEHPNDAPEVIQLADLEKEFHRLSFLVDDTNVHLKKELDVSIQAGEIVGVKDREQLVALSRVLKALDATNMMGRTASVEMSNLENIYIMTTERARVVLGEAENLRLKLIVAREILHQRQDQENLTGASIDISNGREAHYIPAVLPTPTATPSPTPTLEPTPKPTPRPKK